MSRLHRQIAEWALGRDTGLSSMAIARAALGLPLERHPYTPRDTGDLGRCLRLIEKCPGARIGVTRLARVDSEWASLNRRWRKLTALAREEGVFEHVATFGAPTHAKTYALLRSLIR